MTTSTTTNTNSTSVTFGPIEVIEVSSRKALQQEQEQQYLEDEYYPNRRYQYLSLDDYEAEKQTQRRRQREQRRQSRRRSTFPLQRSSSSDDVALKCPTRRGSVEQLQIPTSLLSSMLLLDDDTSPTTTRFAATTITPACPLKQPQRRTSKSMDELKDALDEACLLVSTWSSPSSRKVSVGSPCA